ncbi:unnamed protein product [Lathyrus oleraceus]
MLSKFLPVVVNILPLQAAELLLTLLVTMNCIVTVHVVSYAQMSLNKGFVLVAFKVKLCRTVNGMVLKETLEAKMQS